MNLHNFKTASLIMAMLTIGSASVSAEILTPLAALERATGYMDSASPSARRIKPRSISKASKLVFTVESANNDAAIYVFAREGVNGFALISASDLTDSPILGYSDNSDFKPGEMPVNMIAWLNGYAAQIESAEKAGGLRSTVARSRKSLERSAIAPLMSTKWNQSAPYNDFCPMLYGRRSVTGCVATAEAQVLNHNKFPERPQGKVSYKWATGNQTIECDFDTVPFNYDMMLDSYTNVEASNQQKEAVARLMYACGVASQMNYSPSESGATSLDCARGAYSYFGCTQAGIILCDWMNVDQLNDYVYNYLTKYGPLLYCGQSNSGGHAFVCDGYDGNGYFHFNWGWGGMSDGYFLLNALNPGSQGIGGSSSGYNTNQQLVVGLNKPEKTEDWNPVMAADAGMVISSDYNTVLGDTVMIYTTDEKGGFWNFSIGTINVTYGAKFVKNSTGETTYNECYGIINAELPSMRGWRGYPVVIPENLSEGSYSIYAAYKANGRDWEDFLVQQDVQSYTLATVRGDSILFEKPRPADIEINDIEFGTSLYAGGGFTLTAKVRGTDDRNFYGTVCPVLGEYFDDEFVSDFQGSPMTISARPDETSEFEYAGKFTNQRLKGKYSLVFIIAETGKIISEPMEVEIKPYPGKAIPNSVNASIIDADNVNPNNLRVTADVTSQQGYFSESLFLAVGVEDGDDFDMINRFASPTLYINPGETQKVTFGGAFAATEGEIYTAYLQWYDSATRKYIQIGDPMTFTVKTSAIEEISADDSDKLQEYFSINGASAGSDASKIAPGIYIVGKKKVLVK